MDRFIKRYEILMEKRYNVGEVLGRDEEQWMKDFHNPDRPVQGIYYQLKRVDDPYIDMILQKYDSLKRKEHGLKRVHEVRESYAGPGGAGGEGGDSSRVEFHSQTHKNLDTLVNNVILAIHKKSGGINPNIMDRYVKQIRKKVEKAQNGAVGADIEVKAVINRSTNQIEVKVKKKD